MAAISIIIVNYNAGAMLARCLQSVSEQHFRDFEVILVDNASSDGSLSALPPYPWLNIIRLSENTGFAKANNIGVSKAKGEWIATLNPDAFPTPNWLLAMVNATSRYPDVKMFGSTQINASDTTRLDGTGDIYHILGIPLRQNYQRKGALPAVDMESFAPCAAAALYHRATFLKAGGFDERFFCYCEDIDLAFRLRLMGERCMQIADSIVHHEGSAISGKGSSFATYYGMRNRLWVFCKNMPPILFLLLLPPHAMLQLLFLLNCWRKGQFRAGSKGLWDGVRGIRSILQHRAEVQKTRTVSNRALLLAFTWSPLRLIRR